MIRNAYGWALLSTVSLLAIPALAQSGSQQNYLSITGGIKSELIPAGIMHDTFNSATTLDTTNTWSTPTTSGTGATATYTQGQEILNSGTGTGSYALLTSQATYQVNAPAFLLYRGAINASNPEIVGSCKEMGFFIAAGSPTCAAPVTDGILFEITIAGKLQAVTYASGTRTLLADLSVQTGVVFSPSFAADGVTIVCPGRQTPQAFSDTCPHILDIWFNGNSAEFDVDFKPVAFMQNGSLGPNNNLLPWSAMTINATSTAGATLKINQAAVGDEARTTSKVCDQVTPWNCAAVCPNSATVSVSGGATTQLVALATGTSIRVCSFAITGSTAGTASFVYGTGTTCGGSQTSLTGSMTLATGVPISAGTGLGSLFKTAASNALCLVAGTANVAGYITYAQY